MKIMNAHYHFDVVSKFSSIEYRLVFLKSSDIVQLQYCFIDFIITSLLLFIIIQYYSMELLLVYCDLNDNACSRIASNSVMKASISSNLVSPFFICSHFLVFFISESINKWGLISS